MLTNFYFSLVKLRVGRRGSSKQIAAAEEKLASKLQMAEAAILPLRWVLCLSTWVYNTCCRELSDALQTITDQKLEQCALYPGEAAHPGTVTPPTQPTINHSVAESPLTCDSLRESILAWSPTPANSSSESRPSSLVYGGIHLLRMLLLLPEIFAQMDFQPEQAALVKSLSTSLQRFLADKAGQFVKLINYQ